jgi:5-methylcytosine-specific restriction protein A
MHAFVVGSEYDRATLLRFVGSRQQQTGVIWGEEQQGCTIVTSGGRHGRKAGYFDEQHSDGSWKYFGQGQSGDHLSSNAANKRLLSGNQTILLFLTREPTSAEIRLRGNYRKSFSFAGTYNVCGHEICVPTHGARQGNKLFRFLLAPADDKSYLVIDLSPGEADIVKLRSRILAGSQNSTAVTGLCIDEYRQRSRQIRRYAMLRSRGKCEACGLPAPFVDDRGVGFLEVHHIHRLADDGLDAPENVAAICPNCHKRAHFSADRIDFKRFLIFAARSAEENIVALCGAKNGAVSSSLEETEEITI